MFQCIVFIGTVLCFTTTTTRATEDPFERFILENHSLTGQKRHEFQHLVEQHSDDLERLNMFGMTPLSLAASEGRKEMAETLIEHGAKVDARDRSGDTALHWATHTSIMKVLIDRGADVNVRNTNLETPLHFASVPTMPESHDRVKYLLNQGADVHAKDAHQQTPLHVAAEYSDLEATQALIERGALDDLDSHGQTALQIAMKTGDYQMTQQLRQHREKTNEHVVQRKREAAKCKGFELNQECLFCYQGFKTVLGKRLRGHDEAKTQEEASCLQCLQRYHPGCIKKWAAMKNGGCAHCMKQTFEYLLDSSEDLSSMEE